MSATPPSPTAATRRSRRSWLAPVTGMVGAAVLAVSVNSSLAACTASITDAVDELTAGT